MICREWHKLIPGSIHAMEKCVLFQRTGYRTKPDVKTKIFKLKLPGCGKDSTGSSYCRCGSIENYTTIVQRTSKKKNGVGCWELASSLTFF